VNIVVDDILTFYELTGKGKLLVLLHGWGDSSKGLRLLQTELAKHYKVLAVDLPGFGASEPPKNAWRLDDYANFVAALLAKLKIGSPYAIIGHSNGGAVAIRINIRKFSATSICRYSQPQECTSSAACWRC
jgi:pimeloyl-ACP methyl ester carboxylesterase